MAFHVSALISKLTCHKLNGPKPLAMAISETRDSAWIYGEFFCVRAVRLWHGLIRDDVQSPALGF